MQRLIEKDQETIQLFRRGKISQSEFASIFSRLSKDFLAGIRLYGFPYRDGVDENTYKDAVALSLHLDLNDLKDVFDTYIDNQPADKIILSDKAFFIDKIRIHSGKPQLYGTQYRVDVNKNIEVLPLEDGNNIEKIRKEAGLPPLSEYLDFAKKSLGI